MTGELLPPSSARLPPTTSTSSRRSGWGRARAGRSAPFGRVFPIGARIGESGAAFADGKLDQIYRGIGRGLAALMLSGEATQRWVGFDLTNGGGARPDRADFGWCAAEEGPAVGLVRLRPAQHGTRPVRRVRRPATGPRRGSSSWSHGHLQPGDPGTDQEQRDRLVAERLPAFIAAPGLPAPGQSLEHWFDGSSSTPAGPAAQATRRPTRRARARRRCRRRSCSSGSPTCRTPSQTRRPGSRRRRQPSGYRHRLRLVRADPAHDRGAVERAVSTFGLPATLAMLEPRRARPRRHGPGMTRARPRAPAATPRCPTRRVRQSRRRRQGNIGLAARIRAARPGRATRDVLRPGRRSDTPRPSSRRCSARCASELPRAAARGARRRVRTAARRGRERRKRGALAAAAHRRVRRVAGRALRPAGARAGSRTRRTRCCSSTPPSSPGSSTSTCCAP